MHLLIHRINTILHHLKLDQNIFHQVYKTDLNRHVFQNFHHINTYQPQSWVKYAY